MHLCYHLVAVMVAYQSKLFGPILIKYALGDPLNIQVDNCQRLVSIRQNDILEICQSEANMLKAFQSDRHPFVVMRDKNASLDFLLNLKIPLI